MTYSNEYYHALNRGNEKQLLFFEPENYLFFLRKLKKYSRIGKQDLVAYCLMPNHFHLLFHETVENSLKQTMLVLQTSYAKAINKRYQRTGHLYQDTYKKIHIETNEQLLHVSRYIHLNPVEGNLASLPEDWIYSSYPDYIGTRKGSLPKPDIILNQFPNREAYRDFVMSQIDESDIDGLTLE